MRAPNVASLVDDLDARRIGHGIVVALARLGDLFLGRRLRVGDLVEAPIALTLASILKTGLSHTISRQETTWLK
jgi:hypothetical protein